MRLEVRHLWSPDFDPTEGGPPDRTDFGVLIQAEVGEVGEVGGEVFGFTVCSPSRLAQAEPGMFITDTLVLDRFDWEVIRTRLDKLLMHAQSCNTWDEVIGRLAGMLRHAG